MEVEEEPAVQTKETKKVESKRGKSSHPLPWYNGHYYYHTMNHALLSSTTTGWRNTDHRNFQRLSVTKTL